MADNPVSGDLQVHPAHPQTTDGQEGGDGDDVQAFVDSIVRGDDDEEETHNDAPEVLDNAGAEDEAVAPTQEEVVLDADEDDGNQFDPATLANLAALSRIVNDHDQGEDGQDGATGDAADTNDLSTLNSTLTQKQVQDFVDNLAMRNHEEGQEEQGATGGDGGEEDGDEGDGEDRRDRSGSQAGGEEGDDDGDGDYGKIRDVFESHRFKRKRNRNTLSCTECHRRCDRTIPCKRCIKRGVPSMCRLEAPAPQPRKKRRNLDDIPINYELGLRVQALESLIRSGSNMDTEQASAAAMETILHATRAANHGQQDAANALAQLTQSASAGLGIGGMTQDQQGSLLFDVLQQLSAASNGRSSIQGGGGMDPASLAEMKETWSGVPAAPPETSVQIEQAYEEDPTPLKLNLSLQGFREDNGRIFVPPTVKHVEKTLRNENILAKEALPIEGYAPFLDSGVKFAYGADSPAYRDKRISAIQAVSITGALRLAATFLSRFPILPVHKIIYIPNPTTEEDALALRDAGLEVRLFRFFDRKTGGVDWEGLREDLQASAAAPKSVVLLQISGTTPTGAEMTAPQWRLLTTIIRERQLIPLLVMAFQGLSSGDTNRDAQPLRFMVNENLPVVLCQNFDAMMGLYADSPAIVSVVTQNLEDKERIDSQLRSIARATYFHPPPWGAYVAHQILSDAKLYPAWLAEIKAMSDRLRSVREKLYDVLANKLKTPGTWFHFKRATGMYCTTLLPPNQIEALTTKHHIHLLPDGCLSLGCLNATKIEHLARMIDTTVREGIIQQQEEEAQALAMELALAAAAEEQARLEAEANERAEAEEAAVARLEDTLLMERSIQSAIEAQRIAELEEREREEEERELREVLRKAAERAEVARQAEAILAMI